MAPIRSRQIRQTRQPTAGVVLSGIMVIVGERRLSMGGHGQDSRISARPALTFIVMIPEAFCWTRFGTEAGETIADIIARKELERQACDGLFFWGIGNSVGPALSELVRQGSAELLFSPIAGKPRKEDVSPERVVRWTVGESVDGWCSKLPDGARITSRASSVGRPHYALVCQSEEPLAFADYGSVNFASLRNLLSGRPLGASQVTAVVYRTEEGVAPGRLYPVTLQVTLAKPYFLRLREPV